MHYQSLILDTMLRDFWFTQGRFGVSQALNASAKMKHSCERLVHKSESIDDSSRQGEQTGRIDKSVSVSPNVLFN